MAEIDIAAGKIKSEFLKIISADDAKELQKSFASYFTKLEDKISS